MIREQFEKIPGVVPNIGGFISHRMDEVLSYEVRSLLSMGPLVIGSGSGKEILQPLAVVVLGGLFTSTALTLLVLPALYVQFGRFLMPKKIEPIIQTEIAGEASF